MRLSEQRTLIGLSASQKYVNTLSLIVYFISDFLITKANKNTL